MKVQISFFLALLLSLASSAIAATPLAGKPLLSAVRTSQPPVLDGSLEDEVWAQAQEATGFKQISVEKLPARHPTFVRCLYDAHNLYIGIRCLQPRVFIQTLAKPEGTVWTDDCIELFLTPHISTTLLQTRFTAEQYFHLIFNAAGTRFDELGTGGGSSWDGEWEVKTRVLDNEWQAEVKVPFTTLYHVDSSPPPFASWNVQIARSTVVEPENTTLFPTLGLYRNPVGFGYLIFVTEAQAPASIRWNIDRQNVVAPRLGVLNATLGSMAALLKTKYGSAIKAQSDAVKVLDAEYLALAPRNYTGDVQTVFFNKLEGREREVRALQEQIVIQAAEKTRGSVLLAPHLAVEDDSLVLPDFLPPQDSIGQPLKVTVAPGQYQAASLVAWAKQDEKNILVDVGPLRAKPSGRRKVVTLPASTVDVRWVKCWYQAGTNDIIHEKNILTPELLLKNPDLVTVDYQAQKNITLMTPDMGERDYPGDATTLQPIKLVPARTATQVWLTVRVPKGTPAGIYRGVINVRGNGRLLNRLPIEIRVLDLELAPSMLEHNWYLKSAWGSSLWGQTPQRALAEVQNLARHGVTGVGLLERKNELAAAIDIMKAGGLQTDTLYICREMEAGRAEEEAGEWLKIARDKGVKQLYLYLEDEAKGERLKAQRPSAEGIRRAGAKTFVAGYADYFPIAGDVIDATIMSGGLVGQDLVSKIHGLGHKIFSYGNPQGGVEKPERYRRNYGLLLWQNNYDGAFDFAYWWSFGQGQPINGWSPWDDFQHPYWRQHCMVYPTKAGVVDTIQWEGWREGVTDCRYLATLLREIENARHEHRNGKAIADAEAWLAQLKAGGVAALSDLDDVRSALIRHIEACRKP